MKLFLTESNAKNDRVTTGHKVSRQRMRGACTHDELVDADEERDATNDAIKTGSRIILRDTAVLKKKTYRAVVMGLMSDGKYSIYWVGYPVNSRLSVVPDTRYIIDSVVDPSCKVETAAEITMIRKAESSMAVKGGCGAKVQEDASPSKRQNSMSDQQSSLANFSPMMACPTSLDCCVGVGEPWMAALTVETRRKFELGMMEFVKSSLLLTKGHRDRFRDRSHDAMQRVIAPPLARSRSGTADDSQPNKLIVKSANIQRASLFNSTTDYAIQHFGFGISSVSSEVGTTEPPNQDDGTSTADAVSVGSESLLSVLEQSKRAHTLVEDEGDEMLDILPHWSKGDRVVVCLKDGKCSATIAANSNKGVTVKCDGNESLIKLSRMNVCGPKKPNKQMTMPHHIEHPIAMTSTGSGSATLCPPSAIGQSTSAICVLNSSRPTLENARVSAVASTSTNFSTVTKPRAKPRGLLKRRRSTSSEQTSGIKNVRMTGTRKKFKAARHSKHERVHGVFETPRETDAALFPGKVVDVQLEYNIEFVSGVSDLVDAKRLLPHCKWKPPSEQYTAGFVTGTEDTHSVPNCAGDEGQNKQKINPDRDRSDDSLLTNTMNTTWSTVDICGISIAFPHKTIRENQMVYMTSLMKAIIEGNNAVLESATGTGKIAMMVAVISGWMKHTANAKIETRLNAELSSQLEKNANQVSKVFHPSLSVISPTCRKHTIQILSSICHKTQLGGCFDIKTQLIPHKATNKVHNSITNS